MAKTECHSMTEELCSQTRFLIELLSLPTIIGRVTPGNYQQTIQTGNNGEAHPRTITTENCDLLLMEPNPESVLTYRVIGTCTSKTVQYDSTEAVTEAAVDLHVSLDNVKYIFRITRLPDSPFQISVYKAGIPDSDKFAHTRPLTDNSVFSCCVSPDRFIHVHKGHGSYENPELFSSLVGLFYKIEKFNAASVTETLSTINGLIHLIQNRLSDLLNCIPEVQLSLEPVSTESTTPLLKATSVSKYPPSVFNVYGYEELSFIMTLDT
ncbi:hypothetical protein JW962_02575 [Candidatus Dojkabacteria bacterium]|nr:hypothetical protein [Candidatus Dojkabacteria bacterium]